MVCGMDRPGGGNSPSVTVLATAQMDQGAAPQPDFESIYEELFPFVWRTARGLGVADSALDDVCQDAFVVIHRQLPEFEGRSALKTWVFGILRNVVLVHHRTLGRKSPAHRSKLPLVDPGTLSTPNHSPEEEVAIGQRAELARDLLSELDEEKRLVLILVELEELPVPEVAEAVGVNLNTIYSRLRTARKEFAAAAQRHRAKERWRMT